MSKQSSARERSRTLAPRDFPKSVDAFPLDSRDDAFEWLRRARDWWPDLSAKQHKAAVELAGSVYLDEAKAGRAIGALLASALESGAVELFRAARAAWLELGWRERQHVQAIVSGQETLDGWIFMEHDADYAIVEYYPTRKARHRASKRGRSAGKAARMAGQTRPECEIPTALPDDGLSVARALSRVAAEHGPAAALEAAEEAAEVFKDRMCEYGAMLARRVQAARPLVILHAGMLVVDLDAGADIDKLLTSIVASIAETSPYNRESAARAVRDLALSLEDGQERRA